MKRLLLVAVLVSCGQKPKQEPATPAPTAAPSTLMELRAFLDQVSYASWPAEPEIHASAGPHGGRVRTFFSPELATSLETGAGAHPPGVAAVKELYEGTTLIGHAVMVKLNDGDDWYWYEETSFGLLAVGRNRADCANCHAGGVDKVLSVFPVR